MRWVAVTDESMSYLRESPNERVLVHAVRHPHSPVSLDAADLDVGSFERLAGDALDVEDGKVELPSDGPAFHAWRLQP